MRSIIAILVSAALLLPAGCTWKRPDAASRPPTASASRQPAAAASSKLSASSAPGQRAFADEPEAPVDSAMRRAAARGETLDAAAAGRRSDARGGRKTAYLTFDDGPSASTERILAILRRYGVKATFFVVGTTTDEGKALYKRIAEEGHALGNHTFSHDYRSLYRSPEAFRADVEKLGRLLEETTGVKPDILRYPGGSNNKLGRHSGGRDIMWRIVKDMRRAGYQYFDWNVSSTDAAAPVQDKDMIVASVLGASIGKREAIVLMHDSSFKTTTVQALPTVIEGLRKQGFTFDVLRKSSFTFQFLQPD